MHNKSYWRNRALEYEAELMQICNADLEPKLASFFRDSLNEIEKDLAALYALYQTDNSLSYSQAKKLLRGNEFSNWRMSLREYVALSHTDSKILKELNTLAMRSRITRLEKLYSETLMHLQNLGENYDAAVKDFLTAAYKERYFHGIYDLAKVGKLEIPLTKVQPAKLEQVLNSKWLGGNYSSRIWKNTEKLSATLKTTITQGLHRGLSVQKLSRELSQKMDVSYRNAERLVRTELNFIQNYSAKESLEAAGLEEYEFIAVLDHRTTPRCQALDGTHHLLEEYSPGTNAPPMHPRCRSTISAIVEGGKRTAKVSGKNVKVPADWNYEKWLGSLSRDEPKTVAYKKVGTEYFKTASWQGKLQDAEKAAVTKYTGTYYRVVNGYLRGQYAESLFETSELQELKATIKNLDSAIDKFDLQDNILVYRQCDYRFMKILKNAEKGIYTEKSYLSTSIIEDAVAKRDITLEIKVPKGKGRGAFIEPLSANKGEHEFLIRRGSKFRILNIAEQEDGRFFVELELLKELTSNEREKLVGR